MPVYIFPQVRQLLAKGVYPMNESIPQELRNSIRVYPIYRKPARLSICFLYSLRTLLAIIREFVSGELKEYLTERLIYLGDFTHFIPNNVPFNIYIMTVIWLDIVIEIYQILYPIQFS